MRILVIGMGVVGKTTARGFSELGHSVMCRDLNGDRPVSDVCFICTPEGEVENAVKYND
jgi:predicted dinucleotide-binding enzyme